MIKRRPKPLLIALIILVVLILTTITTYIVLISPTDITNNTNIKVIIPSGTTTPKVGEILKEKKLIRSKTFFSLYVKVKHKSLKASTYTLKKNQSLRKIVNILSEGNSYNENVINLTFKEGQRITDYALLIANNTNYTYEDVISTINDKTYLNELINKYWFLTNNILNEDIYYPLEGYLSPNTYQFDKDVSIKEMIEIMLDQTKKELDEYKDKVNESNIHSYLTIASIVELEGTNTTNRKMIVGVFNNRIKLNMNLGSDVTTYYALQYPMTSDLTTEQFATINPYNTRAINMAGRLPVGPICSPSNSAIEASVNPTDNDYIYFVADKNKKIYYSKTLKEHETTIKEIKDKGDWIW